MNTINKINEDLKTAMKNRDKVSLLVLRQLKSAISNAALSSGNISNEISENDIISIVRKQIKQREDSSFHFEMGQRFDLVDKEKREIEILKKYLPKEMTVDEIRELVSLAVQSVGATSKKDTGKAIKKAIELSEGRVDNKTLSTEISKLLV
jgi:uncharacterized protein YqeY